MNGQPATCAPGAIPPGTLGVMLKTVSEDCNLACDYCYYSRAAGRPDPRRRRIDPALLETVIHEYMSLNRGAVGFAWQGGEPLLAGIAFFELVVALQAKYAPPGTSIGNALQTNGTLITDEWARFFRKYNFLVGVSIDGPREIHDAHRTTASGKGSFDVVMRRIEHLRNHNVDFNILTVLHQGSVDKPRELWAFYQREGFHYVQFIPGMDFRARSPDVPPRYLISADQYGRFLCASFDCWYNDGAPAMSERFFDHALSVCAGRRAETCKYAHTCSPTLVIEQNGDAYPCDFYLSDDHRLGNVGSDTLHEIFGSSEYLQFNRLKEQLPAQCRRCNRFRFCHGGCPRDRIGDGSDYLTEPNYFCSAYRQFFDHAEKRLTLLARRLRTQCLIDYARGGRQWPGRNEACVCGSGGKFKRCCGPLLTGLQID